MNEKLEFLCSIFTLLPKHEILATLKKCQNDQVMAMEELLQVDSALDSFDENDPLMAIQEMFPDILYSEILANWLKCNGNLEQLVHLLLDPSAEPKYQILPPMHKQNSRNFYSKSSENKFDSSINCLPQIFPNVHDDLFYTILNQTNGNLELTATQISQYTMENDSLNIKSQSEHQIYSLLELFPDKSKDTLNSLLKRLKTIDAVVEYLTSKDVIDTRKTIDCDGSCVDNGFPCLVHSSIDSHVSNPKENQSNLWNSKDNQNIKVNNLIKPSSYKRVTQSNSFDISHVTNLNSTNIYVTDIKIKEFRQKAFELRCIRNEHFRKAALSFQKGGIGGRGQAAYYSEEGRKLDSEIIEWNSKAVEAIILNNQRFGGNLIDLHGLTVKEALDYIDDIISKSRGRNQLKIITGRGNNSQGNASKLGPAVVLHLKGKNLQFQAETGSLTIKFNN